MMRLLVSCKATNFHFIYFVMFNLLSVVSKRYIYFAHFQLLTEKCMILELLI